ncbi:MAG: protein nirF [Gammaproteobacteria bacterium]|nr:protein nirF [Gammaproteobacteria bacterium]
MSRLLPFLLTLLVSGYASGECLTRGTGDMGVVVERAAGSLKVVDTSAHEVLFRVPGLGDLSHASVVYSRDGRYAYVFGRDGGLSKIDILCGTIVKRIVQGGNSIGGAISQDGTLIAVSNYEPGGVKIFSSDDLSLIADIPATPTTDREGKPKQAKTVGLVDAPGQRFVVSLYDTGESWIIDMRIPGQPAIQRFTHIGSLPYDALITPDGRYYIAGLFGEDGLSLLDLWHPEKGPRMILRDYGRGDEKLPVYKMPHLEGWAIAGERAFLPAVGRNQILVVHRGDWQETGRVAVHGQPVFVMARPDGRQIWVNFAFPNNDVVQVIDSETLNIVKSITTGKGTLHMEFSPRGEEVWISVRDRDEVQVYDTESFELTHRIPADKPSGIFFTARAHQTGL